MKIIDYFQNNKKEAIIILIIFFFCFFAILPFFNNGIFMTDDGEWMIIRFSSFYQAFADGQFPVRFLHRLNFEYGYPIATFLYPGFMYFGIPFHVLKLGLVETIKTILGLSLVGTVLFTYFWLKKVFKSKLAAFVGGLTSLYLPYHLYDVYKRGSVGEIFALLWVSFIFWMIERNSVFLTSIGIFLLLISHNTVAALFIPLVIIYMLIKTLTSKTKKTQLLRYANILIIGFGMAMFFIFPAIFELRHTQFLQTEISNPSQYLADINLIGIPSIIIVILAGFIAIYKHRSLMEHRLIIWLFLISSFINIFLSSSLSVQLWQFIPSSFIQFPFRLLSYLVISIAFLAAFIVSQTKNQMDKILISINIVIMIIMSSYQFILPKNYTDKGDISYSSNEATTTVRDEYMPIWVKEKPTGKAQNKVQIIRGDGKIENLVYNNVETKFDIESKENVRAIINTIYWPGWEVFIDNQKVKFFYENPKGVIELEIPKGKHQVRTEFRETQLRLFADIVSVVSFISLVIFVLIRRR